MAELEEIRLTDLYRADAKRIEEIREILTAGARAMARSRGEDESDWEDAAQTVFLKLLKMDPKAWEGIDNPRAYFNRAVQNAAIDHIRARHAGENISIDAEAAPIEIAEKGDAAELYERNLLMSEIWKTLDTEDRQLLKMFIFGYTHRETAEILGIGETAVRQRISRLIRNLKKIFSPA